MANEPGNRTDYNSLYKPVDGEDGTGDNYRNDMDTIDARLIKSGDISERPSEAPTGAIFIEDETSSGSPGARWRYDGSAWQKLPVNTDVVSAESMTLSGAVDADSASITNDVSAGSASISGSMSSDSASVTNGVTAGSVDTERVSSVDVNNEINCRAIDGNTLYDRVVNALNTLETSGRIRIPRPEGGGVWTWDQDLTLDLETQKSVQIVIDRGVQIEYTGTGTMIDVLGPDTGNQNKTFSLHGPGADVKSTADAQCFLQGTDVLHFECNVNTRDFTNSTGDCTVVKLRNNTLWSEGSKFGGDWRNCDRGLEYLDGTETGGEAGAVSFLDGYTEHLSINFLDYGIRFTGNHKSNSHVNLHLFPSADGATGMIFDGNMDGTTFVGPRIDDAGTDNANITGIETGTNMIGTPILIGMEWNRVETKATAAETNHDVWELTADGGGYGFNNLTQGGSLEAVRKGGVRIKDDTDTTTFEVNGIGHIQEIGNFNAEPYFPQGLRADRTEFKPLSSAPSSPTNGDVAYADGTGWNPLGDGTAGLFCYEEGAWVKL